MRNFQSNAAAQSLFPEVRVAPSAIDATWEIRPRTGEHRLSPRSRALLDIGYDEPVSIQRLVAAIYPPDRERWRNAMEDLLDPEGTGVLRVDFRTAQRPGRWLTATGRAFFDGLTPVKVVGTFRQPALLAEICAEVVDEAAREHPSHPIHFERWDDAPGEWDPYPLTEVARSLIGSAVMRSDPGAPIVVSVANCGEQALMIVADLGEPLPKEIREHLLDPEHHDDVPSTHPTLCSAVEIVQAHGGRLDLSSEHDSTVFHVWLPRVRRLALGARS